MSMLPIFYGKPSNDPYTHVDKRSQVCEINQIHNVPADVMKMITCIFNLNSYLI